MNDFQMLCGEEILRCCGDSSPLGGALESAKEFGWDVIPTVDCRASPSATVEDEVVEQFWLELESRLEQPIDAVYLVLHGAMVSQSLDDVEGEILERLRQAIGPSIPIFGVFDLHANFTQRMASLANCLVAYRENPHTDARQAARIAAELLQRTLFTGRIPRMFWRHPPLMWPPTGVGTAVDPMRSLERLARDIEARSPDLWAVSVCAGGDGTGLFRALIAYSIQNAAIAITDPIAVRELSKLAIGMRATLAIGGHSSKLDTGPLVLDVELQRFGSGLFQLEDKQSHLASMSGDSFDMGPCAVVRFGGLTILLTSNRTPPFDLGQWRRQGIEPTELTVIVVKAAVAHRRAYDPIAARMFWVDTPGPCTSNLRMLPFQKIQRPVFPLD